MAIPSSGSGAEAPDPGQCLAVAARAELDRVLGSSRFDASERNRRFLEYVVAETLAGRAERIKAYSIATIVFGRDANFDAQLDPVVRMEARRLRRSLERFYLTEGTGNSVRITMPKGRYVPEFQRTLAAQSDSSSFPTLALARVARLPGSSILVMPFDAEGGCSIVLDYSDGFTRQLLVGLSRFPELRVFGPTGVVGGSSKPNREPRDNPQVDFVLSGSTAVFAEILNVKAMLADAATGEIIWGQTFEHDLRRAGILGARDSVADSIVRTLARPFGVLFVKRDGLDADVRAPDPLPYDCLSSFYGYRRSYRRDLFPVVRERLERMVIADPVHSDVFACLSQIYTDGHRLGFAPGESVAGLRRQAAEFAQRAIDLAPYSSRGHHAQGLAHWFLQDVAPSLEALQTALELNPNATEVAADLGLCWSLLGDWDRGICLLQQALEQEPLQADSGRVAVSLYHFANGRFEKALAEARRIRSPHVTYGLVCRAIALVRLGRREEASASIGRMLSINPHCGCGVLAEWGGGNIDAHLAGEIETALTEAGLATEIA